MASNAVTIPTAVKAAKSSALAQLIALVDEAFDHVAWHGPTLLGSIRGVTAEQAAWRPGPGRHNIWEVAVHAAYWKYAVRRRLTGEKRGSFPLKGSNWFPFDELTAGVSDQRNARGREGAAWKDHVRLLIEQHRQLRAAVVALPPAALVRPVHGKRHTAGYTIRGIAAHDVYHAGQIQLLKRLQA